ncbi:MAG: DUF1016 N-terminal domain-containing protein [Leptospira sp.]|nr:DUF1016 N-terminal domain-containing protein [Leptospira sp.]
MGNNRLALEANLEIGRKIAEAGHDDEENSKYERFIEKLSRDLNRKFGKGFSERSLFEVIKFYQGVKLDYRLGWSHYRVLMRVKDPEKVRNV